MTFVTFFCLTLVLVINQSIIIFIFVLELNTINLPCGNVEGENGVVENFDAMKKRLQ